MQEDTIFALSSAKGVSGISVYRVSGNNAFAVMKKLCKGYREQWQPNQIYLTSILDGDILIDIGCVAFFQGPHSFTGEDVVEFFLHGSLAITKIFTEAVIKTGYSRVALPGEFTRRALLNNKMDMVQVEGLADLLNAQTFMQHKNAIKHYSHELSDIYIKWRKALLNVSANIEASIDFSAEDIPGDLWHKSHAFAENVIADINKMLDGSTASNILTEGAKMVILGRPNVGKSSLFNYLCKQDEAIISSIPGTTRDMLKASIDIRGYKVILVDTAGLRASDDEIELEGIKRAKNAAKNADIVLRLYDIYEENITAPAENEIIVINKIDLDNNPKKVPNSIYISVNKDINMEKIYDAIERKLKALVNTQESIIISNMRHKQLLIKCKEALNGFIDQKDLVLAAENLRMAISSISNLIGDIGVEDILAEIFSSFCIGK